MDKNDYIFGIRAILEAIEAGKSIDKVLLRREIGGDLAKELIEKVREYDIVMQRVPLEKLNRITMKNHQGAIALLSPVGYHKVDNVIPQLYEDGKTPLAVGVWAEAASRKCRDCDTTGQAAGGDFYG